MVAEAFADLTSQADYSSRAHLDEIVLEFGIDRIIKYLSQYGTLIIAVVVVALGYNNPVSCMLKIEDLDQSPSFQPDGTRDSRSIHSSGEFHESDTFSNSFKSQTGPFSTKQMYNMKYLGPNSALKSYIDFYCWEKLDDLKFIDLEPSSGGQIEHFDPRDLMGDFMYFLILQLIILPIPYYIWIGVVGGTVKGHITYVQQLINKVTEVADKIHKVQPQKLIPGKFNRDIYDKYSESIKPWIFPSHGKDPDMPGISKGHEINDRKMLNLLYHENMAHFWQYPYLTSVYILKYLESGAVGSRGCSYESDGGQALKVNVPHQTAVTATQLSGTDTHRQDSENIQYVDSRQDHRKKRLEFIRGDNKAMSKKGPQKIDKLEAILSIWTHKENMIESYLVWTYIFKQVLTILFCTGFIFLYIYYFDGKTRLSYIAKNGIYAP